MNAGDVPGHLLRQYLDQLPAKLSALERGWQLMAESVGAESEAAELRLQVHRLAGSAGSYGLSAVGEKALILDTLLKRWPGDQVGLERIEVAFIALKSELILALATNRASAPAAPARD